jgi:chromosome segregation ATPase
MYHMLSDRTAPTSAPVAQPPPSKLKAQVAKVLYHPDADANGPHVPHDELQQIKDSVERLRAQRTHVEQLRERNERLELLLADRAKETDKLRLQLVSMQGVEQENVGLLKSFQLLEQRIHALEATCHERKEDVRIANERLAASDKARATLQLHVDELAGEREYLRQQLGTVQSAHESRVRELQASHDRALENERRDQSEWQRKAQELELAQGHVERKFQDELAQRQSETQQLVQENRAMEQRVQQLLATTVRQTTMIEDCDRLLRESKSRHETAKASYRDQLQLNTGLQTQIKELEIKLSTREQGLSQEKTMLEAKLAELETKARKLKDKNAIYVVALQEKEALCEKLQSELLIRDRARFHVEDVVKELRQKEKALLSEISTLKVALTVQTSHASQAVSFTHVMGV